MAEKADEATPKLAEGGLERVTIMATSWAHARGLFEAPCAADRMMNLHHE